jgi:hypothetical protein
LCCFGHGYCTLDRLALLTRRDRRPRPTFLENLLVSVWHDQSFLVHMICSVISKLVRVLVIIYHLMIQRHFSHHSTAVFNGGHQFRSKSIIWMLWSIFLNKKTKKKHSIKIILSRNIGYDWWWISAHIYIYIYIYI